VFERAFCRCPAFQIACLNQKLVAEAINEELT
jgi:hypothetical protein